jgi:hypothetical protein
MCRFRPNNRLSVTPGKQEKPLPAVRKSMVRFGEASLRRFDELCEFFGVKNDN